MLVVVRRPGRRTEFADAGYGDPHECAQKNYAACDEYVCYERRIGHASRIRVHDEFPRKEIETARLTESGR